MASKLPNYLKTHRKRAGFSQDDIAFLLGTQSGAKVCRYERFTREPSLRTALAYLVIFEDGAEELFAGIYDVVKHEVINRAQQLAEKQSAASTNRFHKRKKESLAAIIKKFSNSHTITDEK